MTIFIKVYNKKKKRFLDEKANLKATFEHELSKAHFEVREQTMETIASDLHDNIGQLLGVTSLTLASINITNQPIAAEKLTAAHELVSRSIIELRHLAKLMQSSSIIQDGLEEAIKNELAYIEKSGRFKVHFQCDNFSQFNIPQEKEIIVFRICQELINNILKHAQASEIRISLSAISGILNLVVADNGKGFENLPKQSNLGIGLQNIKKRIAILGGEITFKSQQNLGSTVNVIVPF